MSQLKKISEKRCLAYQQRNLSNFLELCLQYHFILDDTTGNIVINTGDIDFSFNEGDLIKVIGDLQINLEGDKEIKAEIVNDMKGLNFDYYLRLYNLKKEFL